MPSQLLKFTSSLLIWLVMAGLVASMAIPPSSIAQTAPTSGTKTMQDYIDERGFYEPNGTVRKQAIAENRAAFDMVRDYAAAYAPLAGADPVLVVWWTFIETKAPYNTYTYNNCVNKSDYAPEYVCPSDNWQIAWGQQFNVAYNQLVPAFTAIYGDPNNKQKVQEVMQNVLIKSGVGGTAPADYTVADLAAGGGVGEPLRKWALMLSRDPAMSVYLLGTALVHIDRDEVLGYGYSQADWQAYSNGLNDVLEAWGVPGTPSDMPGASGVGTGQTWGPTEPPLELEVPDCPGVTRTIDASHLPPSIYPKPSCGAGSSTGNMPVGTTGLGQPSGTYGTSVGAPAAGSLFWVITGGKVYEITQGYGLTDFAKKNTSLYDYCNRYSVPGHCGVDVGTPTGTLIYTPVAGKVICAGTNVPLDPAKEACTSFPSDVGVPGENGRFQIELANGDMLIFGHMSKITVEPGQQLQAGDPVGLTGVFNGPHFHIEYRHLTDTGSWVTYDPRDMLDVAANGSTSAPTGEVGPTAQRASGSDLAANVLADTAMATTPDEMQQKYGFNQPDGQSGLPFAKYADNFAVERDLAVKYAPEFNLEPQLVVWWTWAETAPPYDSYHYQNCQENSSYPLDQACGATGFGSWQVGYGQQYAMGAEVGMDQAFLKTHGDPNNATLVQQVGQNVLSKTGISKSFPAKTINELMANEPANRYWLFTLQRDQAMSVYLTAANMRMDLDGQPGKTYRDIMAGWGSYYQTHWQDYSNMMADVMTNWGLAASTTPGMGCDNVSTTTPTSSCSTIPTALNGSADAAEFVQNINDHMDLFRYAETCAQVPWQAMAAIATMENGLDLSLTNPWNLYPAPNNTSDQEKAICDAAKVLQLRAQEGAAGAYLTPNMDPSVHDNEVALKDAFWGYNGREDYSDAPEDNLSKGCRPDVDGNADWDWDCSGYVMSGWDTNHQNYEACSSPASGGQQSVCQTYTKDGAWKIYFMLYNSTFSSDGVLLVYGGKCNLTTGVVNGLAIPTAANKGIGSQFFNEVGHIGIDISNVEGDPVFAIADGEVINSGWVDNGGYYVLQHIPANVAGNNSERWVYYGHLSPTGFPAPGTHLTAGQQIGTTGPHIVVRNGVEVTNGVQTAPHLHFDIRTTTSGAGDPAIHVNPCSIDLFKQSYPALDCTTRADVGVAW